MERLIRKYTGKLVQQGLCRDGDPLMAAVDADTVWSRGGNEQGLLQRLIDGLNINSILFARPAFPYDRIIDQLAGRALSDGCAICPEDTETRTFLHDIPVAAALEYGPVVAALKRRKSVVIPGHGIITTGSVSPEQAFITYSSVCFSCYVKMMADFYHDVRRGGRGGEAVRPFVREAVAAYDGYLREKGKNGPALRGPFRNGDEVIGSIVEAGRLVIESRMVDSFFGNISCRFGDAVYISQTGSSLDELAGNIDRCPLDKSSCSAITASSEFSAHRGIYEKRGVATILHGHPKFSVILSMLCDDDDCTGRGRCHLECRRERSAAGIPIVPGEVGTGPRGLCNTLPGALRERGAIVYGHGLFTVGETDFTDAYAHMLAIETGCLTEFRRATGIGD